MNPGAFSSAYSAAFDVFSIGSPRSGAGGPTDTRPYCGSCGWDAIERDVGSDLFCDSCGADLTRFGFTA